MGDPLLARLSAVIEEWAVTCPETEAALRGDVAGVVGGFRDMTLRSVFRPLFSAHDLQPVAPYP